MKNTTFTEEINNISLRSNDNKIIQSIDSKETSACGTSKDVVCQKEEINCNNIIKQYKNVLQKESSESPEFVYVLQKEECLSAGAQPDIFQSREGGGFVELRHFDKNFVKNTRKRSSKENSTQRWTQ